MTVNDEPLVSVLLPAYNVEKYLAKCVDSILQQTYQNFEIIIVDDCSPDDSGKIADKLRQRTLESRFSIMEKTWDTLQHAIPG